VLQGLQILGLCVGIEPPQRLVISKLIVDRLLLGRSQTAFTDDLRTIAHRLPVEEPVRFVIDGPPAPFAASLIRHPSSCAVSLLTLGTLMESEVFVVLLDEPRCRSTEIGDGRYIGRTSDTTTGTARRRMRG